MLTGSDDIVYLFSSYMHSILFVEPVFCNEQAVVIPKGVIVKVREFIIDLCMSKIPGGFLPAGNIEGFAHSSLDKGIVNGLMALPAGIHAHILR